MLIAYIESAMTMEAWIGHYLTRGLNRFSGKRRGIGTDQKQALLKDMIDLLCHQSFQDQRTAMATLTSGRSPTDFRVGKEVELIMPGRADDRDALMALKPWRKGPFTFAETHIDSEWRSWMKWDRIQPHLPDLKLKTVVDVGCGNGYYLYRLTECEPVAILGLDPYPRFWFQFGIFAHLLKHDHIVHLPLGFEALDQFNKRFDLALCAGIVYHHHDPIRILRQIKTCLKPGGTAIVETLIWPGDEAKSVTPPDRYAKMSNIYFIPTVSGMGAWAQKAGFHRWDCVDKTMTSTEEQRQSSWIHSQSMEDFLDPTDSAKTVEGYPAPCRAIFKLYT